MMSVQLRVRAKDLISYEGGGTIEAVRKEDSSLHFEKHDGPLLDVIVSVDEIDDVRDKSVSGFVNGTYNLYIIGK